MVITYLLMLIFDAWAIVFDSQLLQAPNLIKMFINGLDLLAISIGCYFWFRFILARLYPNLAANFRFQSLMAIPILAIGIMDFVSVFTGFIFFINSNGAYDITVWFNAQAAVNYFYLVIPTVFSLIQAFHSHSSLQKKEYFTYAAYMIAPLVSGLLEEVFPKVPLLALNIFLVVHILFLMMQSMQVNSDALTKLANRRNLNHYLEESLLKASKERPLTLLMLDSNGFKSSNDKYGHLEGDNALKLFAAVLKKAETDYSAFAARYGGDEFCFVLLKPGISPEKVSPDIHARLKEAQKSNITANEAPFTVSIGYTQGLDSKAKPEAIIKAADDMLYFNKNEWHRVHDKI